MERAKIKGYISENLDQISDKFLAEIAQSIHDYHLDQASQEIQALNLTEFTHEQLAQLVGVPVAVIEERSKPRENRQEKVSQHKLPNQIMGYFVVKEIYTGKIQKRYLPIKRCWFDETKQCWIQGMHQLKEIYRMKHQTTSEEKTVTNHQPNHKRDSPNESGENYLGQNDNHT